MASSIPMRFSPQALARPNKKDTPNPSKPVPKKLSTKPNPKLKSRTTTSRKFPRPQLSSVPGSEATSYTRLPPKEDFLLPSFDYSSQSSTEVTLFDTINTRIPKQKPSDNEIDTENDEFGFDYGKFELYEVDSDSENDNNYDNDDDDDDEEEEEEMLGLGFKDEAAENVFVGEGFEEGEGEEKEKGVPAVMRCFDRAKIFVKAGDGGNGVMAFRREKFVPFGGPSGGDGGRGGNVYFEVDGSMNSLLTFRQSIHFRAGRGCHGRGSKQNGAKGEDVVVNVPPGTVIREAGNDGFQGEVLLELLHPGQRALVLPGGKGGRGNAAFKSGANKVPKIAENGEEGPEM